MSALEIDTITSIRVIENAGKHYTFILLGDIIKISSKDIIASVTAIPIFIEFIPLEKVTIIARYGIGLADGQS